MKSEERERLDAFKETEHGGDNVSFRIYNSYYMYDGTINAKELNKALKLHRTTAQQQRAS